MLFADPSGTIVAGRPLPGSTARTSQTAPSPPATATRSLSRARDGFQSSFNEQYETLWPAFSISDQSSSALGWLSPDLGLCSSVTRTSGSVVADPDHERRRDLQPGDRRARGGGEALRKRAGRRAGRRAVVDRKSTRLNSSHLGILYAVFCLYK